VPTGAGLDERGEAELATPAGEAARAFVAPIRRRHGEAVAAILFYGSCLRRGRAEGVLDFYVLVDGYRAAFGGSRSLAAAGALLPPTVFYLETSHEGAPLRAKYAVMTRRDFARAAGRRAWQPRVWARFAQPSALVWARDAALRREVAEAVGAATRTTLEWALAFASDPDGAAPADPARLMAAVLRETYRAELRSERGATVETVASHAAARRGPALAAALEELAARGRVRRTPATDGGPAALAVDPRQRRRARARWRVQRPVAKGLAVLGLLKTAATFDDWVPYVLWKLERHSGRPIEITDRQRRHPFLYGWPVIWRLLRTQVLR
jgi:hypothetical protein